MYACVFILPIHPFTIMLQSRFIHSGPQNYSSAREISVHRQPLTETLGLHLIEKLFHSCAIVLQDTYMNVTYMSENSVHLFGYPVNELKNNIFRRTTAFLPVEDKDPFLRARQKTEEIARSIPQHELPEYRFIMNYRFRKADGKYIHLQEERVAIADASGMYSYVVIYKDISVERPFIRVHLQWLKYQNGGYVKVNAYVPTAGESSFSQREIEVLQLIKEGFSSKQIADTLCISINTVRNHRSNLFKKTSAKNMIELLNYAEAMQ